MSKEKNDLFVVILFSIIWVVRPISYDEMRIRHPIYPQENVVVVNSSSISTQNDELEFLESTTKEIILAKDTNGSFFTEGFQPPLPKRPGS
jgi:dihydrofolate reductase